MKYDNDRITINRSVYDNMKQEFTRLKSVIDLQRELLSRLTICCGELHHRANEFHDGKECSLMVRFEEVIPTTGPSNNSGD